MKVHFIAIGGSVMHSLAIALKHAGITVTGSDDVINDPAKSRLAAAQLLPATLGWNPDNIHADLDAVILGMHAFEDNPELLKAKELGLKVYSYPEFILQQSLHKQRVVIAGSYGKTTLTSMIMHVLKLAGKNFDYLVGAQVPGFDNPVKLTEDAPVIIIEGDEYLASKLDPRPKFLVYEPHIALISGISWDHINVFPTEVEYIKQFGKLIAALPKAGILIYNDSDKELKEMVKPIKDSETLYIHGYHTPTYRIKDGKYVVTLGDTALGGITNIGGEKIAVSVMGKHNMLNIAGAWKVCQQLGVDTKTFLTYISTFKGAASRLEILSSTSKQTVIKDFAHAPAKVAATVEAVNEMYAKKNVIACFELHTFSSLNPAYLKNYANTLKGAKSKIVYVNPETFAAKRMLAFTKSDILKAFNDNTVQYTTDKNELLKMLQAAKNGNDVLLMMSSSNFGGLDLNSL